MCTDEIPSPQRFPAHAVKKLSLKYNTALTE